MCRKSYLTGLLHRERVQGEEYRSASTATVTMAARDVRHDYTLGLRAQGLPNGVLTPCVGSGVSGVHPRNCLNSPWPVPSTLWVLSLCAVQNACHFPLSLSFLPMYHAPRWQRQNLVARFETLLFNGGLLQLPASGHPSDIPVTQVSCFYCGPSP